MTQVNEVWVVDDDRSIRWVLEKALARTDKPARIFENAEYVIEALKSSRPRAMVTDIRMPGMSGIELLGTLQTQHPRIPVVIMTAFSDLDSAVSAYKDGAFEYLPKPFDVDEAVDIIERAFESSDSSADTSGGNSITDDNTSEIIGKAPAMQEVFRTIGRLVRSDVTVLITGESGTGKELVARALHRHSVRKKRPFIAMNMAAIPKDLMEAEIFGHEKGSFTGADTRRQGRFEQAHGGTLFMDEIGDMPAELQTRLLRVLSGGGFYRIGGHAPVKADVRIIAATHQDLLERVASGKFREDLYHRLNVIRIHLPALRERSEDIPLLAQNFLTRIGHELGIESRFLTDEATQHLMKLKWLGNVRELENACRWLTVMCHSRKVYVRDLPAELRNTAPKQVIAGNDWQESLSRWLVEQYQTGDTEPVRHVVEQTEQILIRAALRLCHGKKHEAAHLLGWGRNTLTRKVRHYGME